jgi:hypothetical protein
LEGGILTTTTRRVNNNGSKALDYNRLPEPWREWANIARSFAWKLDDRWDRQDLMHNIIVRLAEVAEVYRKRGIPFHRGACIKVAEYTRLRFYHQKKRWKRVYSVSLNGIIRDDEGYETEIIHTISDNSGIDRDVWADFKDYFHSRPRKEKHAIRKLVMEGGRSPSGYDWKLIRRFRAGYKS